MKDLEGAYEDLHRALALAPDEPELQSEKRKLIATAQRHEEEQARLAKQTAAASLEEWLAPGAVAAVR